MQWLWPAAQGSRLALLEVVDPVVSRPSPTPTLCFPEAPGPMLGTVGLRGWQMARSLLAAQEQLAAGVEADFMVQHRHRTFLR
jgi:hypothetical protein